MKLTFYRTSSFTPEIRPSVVERQWMEDSQQKFAYRCLPLNIANAHGWEILCPCSFTATWDGGNSKDSIRIQADTETHLMPMSHFGDGILTFPVQGLIRTEENYNLWVSGSPNQVKRAIAPLTGIIETDWAPYTFTMNWKFTESLYEVEFIKGEPFCFMFPIRRNSLEIIEPRFRDLTDNQKLHQAYTKWSESRNDFNQALENQGSEAQTQKWQKSYFRGLNQDNEKVTDSHQTKLKLQPFKDESNSNHEI